MKRSVIVILYLLLAVLFLVYGRYCGSEVVKSVFKALPLMALSTFLLLSMRKSKERGGIILCLFALLFSIAGDTFGEFKGKGIRDLMLILQISSFAIAHIIYIISFTRHFRRMDSRDGKIIRILFCLMIVLYSVFYFEHILTNIADTKLLIAATFYLGIISIMVMASALQIRQALWCFIAGAVLFLVSDSILAYRLFIGPITNAGIYIMSSYYAAQLLLNIQLIKNEA